MTVPDSIYFLYAWPDSALHGGLDEDVFFGTQQEAEQRLYELVDEYIERLYQRDVAAHAAQVAEQDLARKKHEALVAAGLETGTFRERQLAEPVRRDNPDFRRYLLNDVDVRSLTRYQRPTERSSA